jgi:hypothetical protein
MKPLDDFHKDRSALDGLHYFCKECRKRPTPAKKRGAGVVVRALVPADVKRTLAHNPSTGLPCPTCGGITRVVNTVPLDNGTTRRVRCCIHGHRTVTIERVCHQDYNRAIKMRHAAVKEQ